MTYSNLAQGVFFFRAVPPPRAAGRLCGKRRGERLHRAPGVWPRLLSLVGSKRDPSFSAAAPAAGALRMVCNQFIVINGMEGNTQVHVNSPR